MKRTVISSLIIAFMIIATPGCKPTNGELINKAYDLNRAGKHQQAIDLYTEVIRNNGQLQLAYYNRGFAYTALEQYDKALKDFNTVISLQKKGDLLITWNDQSPVAGEEAKMQVPYDDALYQCAQVRFSMDSLTTSFLDFQELINRNYKHKINCLLWLGMIRVKTAMPAEGCAYFNVAKAGALQEEDQRNAQQLIDRHCPTLYDAK